ncbi:MAG: arsenic metallochaperone ArsD family protein [Desulfonatronovibrio sp.]
MARYNLDIFVPYMGCPCGPSNPQQDKQAEDFQNTLLKLKDRHKHDIVYMVYALNLHLQQFRERPELARILQEQGQKGLPAIFLNDQLVMQGKYPDLAEFEKLLQPADS